MKNRANIDIVIAVYKPNSMLFEQLNSIKEQSYYDHIKRIILCDDDLNGDMDLDKYKFISEKIEIKKNISGYHGAKNNFSYGLSLSDSDYIMTCDQDDYWLPNKVEVSFREIERLEKECGREKPLLVSTDTKIVDENLNTLHESFYYYRGVDLNKSTSFECLLFRNTSPGCTMIFNKYLLDMALPVPNSVIMHDWWLILIASYFGKLSVVNEATMLYRQHESNCLGAKKNNLIESLLNKNLFLNIRKNNNYIYAVIEQSKSFFLKFDNSKLNNNVFKDLIGFSELSTYKKFRILTNNFEMGILKSLVFLINDLLKS